LLHHQSHPRGATGTAKSNNYVSKQSIINRPKASPELLFFYSDRYPQISRSKIPKVIQDKVSHLEGVKAQMEGEI
jgi:hypothetical protein